MMPKNVGTRKHGGTETRRILRVSVSPRLRVSLYLIPPAFLTLFYFYPLSSIFRLSLAPE